MYTRTRCRATLRRPAWPGKLIYPSDHAVGLLVGEVTAGLVVELFHAGKLIYPSYTFGGRAVFQPLAFSLAFSLSVSSLVRL